MLSIHVVEACRLGHKVRDVEDAGLCASKVAKRYDEAVYSGVCDGILFSCQRDYG